MDKSAGGAGDRGLCWSQSCSLRRRDVLEVQDQRLHPLNYHVLHMRPEVRQGSGIALGGGTLGWPVGTQLTPQRQHRGSGLAVLHDEPGQDESPLDEPLLMPSKSFILHGPRAGPDPTICLKPLGLGYGGECKKNLGGLKEPLGRYRDVGVLAGHIQPSSCPG